MSTFESMDDRELRAWVAYYYAIATDLGREKIKSTLR